MEYHNLPDDEKFVTTTSVKKVPLADGWNRHTLVVSCDHAKLKKFTERKEREIRERYGHDGVSDSA